MITASPNSNQAPLELGARVPRPSSPDLFRAKEEWAELHGREAPPLLGQRPSSRGTPAKWGRGQLAKCAHLLARAMRIQ